MKIKNIDLINSGYEVSFPENPTDHEWHAYQDVNMIITCKYGIFKTEWELNLRTYRKSEITLILQHRMFKYLLLNPEEEFDINFIWNYILRVIE